MWITWHFSTFYSLIFNFNIVIYGRFVLDIVRKLPSGDIDIEEVDGGKAIISTQNSKYNLNCFDVNDFPKINMEEIQNPIMLTPGNSVLG